MEQGLVRLEYRHYIVLDRTSLGESRRAALAAECAAEQGEFWNYHNMLFANLRGENIGSFTENRLKAFAEAIGLDTEQFNTCLDTRRYADEIAEDERLGTSLGVQGTPTVFVNGVQVQNPLDYNEIRGLVEAQLPQEQ